MTEAELKKDWLAGNAVIAFASALLLAQQWRSTDAVYDLPLNVTIPALSDPFTFVVAASLFILSLLLALSSVVPTEWVPAWVIAGVIFISLFLGLLAWALFGYSWITGVFKLPADQWWTGAFACGGFVMVLLLLYRWVSSLVRRIRSIIAEE